MLKKTIRKIHLVLGLVTGLVVFILGITGSIWVFIEELKPLVYSDRMFVDQRLEDSISFVELLELAQRKIGDEKRTIQHPEAVTGPGRIILGGQDKRQVAFFPVKKRDELNGSGGDFFLAQHHQIDLFALNIWNGCLDPGCSDQGR